MVEHSPSRLWDLGSIPQSFDQGIENFGSSLISGFLYDRKSSVIGLYILSSIVRKRNFHSTQNFDSEDQQFNISSPSLLYLLLQTFVCFFQYMWSSLLAYTLQLPPSANLHVKMPVYVHMKTNTKLNKKRQNAFMWVRSPCMLKQPHVTLATLFYIQT